MTDNSSTSAPSDTITARCGVLVVTNVDDDGPAVAAARAVAAELASRSGVQLVLYDRSEETWGDSQHPEGPLDPDDGRLDDRPALRDQLREAEELGAKVRGWVATLPTISAVATALQETNCDVVVVPEDLQRKLLERALVGGDLGDVVVRQLDQNKAVEAKVIEVAADGTVRRAR